VIESAIDVDEISLGVQEREKRLTCSDAMFNEATLGFDVQSLKEHRQADISILPYDHDRLSDDIILLKSAMARMATYAISDRESSQSNWTSFESEGRDALDIVKQDHEKLFSGYVFTGDQKSLKEKLAQKVTAETSMVQTGINEKDQAKLRKLLGIDPNNCK
jgi:hypothetical protein